uniref:Transmembrane protein n=2 Tax=Solanum tuberosum TaxID=4113 RepID=M1CS24_SOLTU
MGSQGVVLATAVVVSAGTIVVFDLLRQKYLSIAELELTNNNQKSPRQNPLLKSCLSSGDSFHVTGEKNMNSRRKKKRVHFAADVKDSNSNGEEYRRGGRNTRNFSILPIWL